MTTIAWDGTTLATDSQETHGTYATYGSKKLYKVNGCLVAVAGRADRCQQFIDWVDNGFEGDKPFDEGKGEDSDFVALVVDAKGKAFAYYDSLVPVPAPSKQAFGSGGPLALGLMASGLTAKQAVELMCKKKLDAFTGGKVQSATIQKQTRKEEKSGN